MLYMFIYCKKKKKIKCRPVYNEFPYWTINTIQDKNIQLLKYVQITQ